MDLLSDPLNKYTSRTNLILYILLILSKKVCGGLRLPAIASSGEAGGCVPPKAGPVPKILPDRTKNLQQTCWL